MHERGHPEAVICGEEAKVIGEELGLSESAVRGRLERVRKKFCELVEKSGLSHLRLRVEEQDE